MLHLTGVFDSISKLIINYLSYFDISKDPLVEILKGRQKLNISDKDARIL